MVPERARERILDLAATQLPTGGAYHQYQPLTKRGNDAIGSGFNDDPLWLDPRRRRVREGDRRPADPRRAGRRTTTSPGSETPLYEHLAACARVHARPARPARAAADRAGRLERLPQPQRFSETPGESFQTTENREGGVAESVFIAGLFVLAAEELAALAERPRTAADAARAPGARGAMIDGGPRARLGRRVVPPRVRLLRAPGRLRRERRGADLHRAAGHVRHGGHRPGRRPGRPRPRRGARAPRDAARHRAARSPRTPGTTSSSARSPPIRPATRRTAGSSATPTRGS